jgi:D-amino-acid dehydrogenase
VENKKYDVVIIGGGVIGLFSAYYLNKQGRSVLVIDKGPKEEASSHANCGLVSPSHALPLNSPELILKSLKWLFRKDSPFYIKPQWNLNFTTWMLGFGLNSRQNKIKRSMEGRNSLLLNSRQLYDDFFETEQVNSNWSKQGIMFAFLEEKSFDEYVEKDLILSELDPLLQATPLVGADLRQMEPALSDNVHGGWWYEIDASLKPDELVSELKELLVNRGVEFANDTEVQTFEIAKGQITRVDTSKGSYYGSNYVLASGAWSPLIARQLDLNIPIIPGKGYSITMDKPGISPRMPCIMEEKKVVATPWKSSYRLGGTMEFAGYDSTLNPTRFGALKKAAELYMTDPYTDNVIEEWYGWRPMTNNDLPIIDFSKKLSNLLLACGHNMLGLSMAPSTGKLVSELLCDKAPHVDISFYSFRGNLG